MRSHCLKRSRQTSSAPLQAKDKSSSLSPIYTVLYKVHVYLWQFAVNGGRGRERTRQAVFSMRADCSQQVELAWPLALSRF